MGMGIALNLSPSSDSIVYDLFKNLTAAYALDAISGAARWKNLAYDIAHAVTGRITSIVGGRANFVAASKDWIEIEDNAAISPAGRSFTISVCVNADVVTTGWIIGKVRADADNNHSEIFLYLGAGGAINFRMANSGATGVTTLTADQVLAVGTDTQIIIGYDGVNMSIKVGTNPIKTVACASGYDSPNKLSFGRAGEFDGGYYDGRIYNAQFWMGRYLNAAEQALLIGKFYPFANAGFQISTLDPSVFTLYDRHDFSNVDYLFTDAAKTTKVAADGDLIRVAKSLVGNHDWVAPSDARRWTWKAAIQNGLGIGRLTGTDPEDVNDSELDTDASFPPTGDFTAFWVCYNSDNVAGSHIMAGDAHYLFLTGAGYDATSPRAGAHVADNNAVTSSGLYLASNVFVILELTRSGNDYTFRLNGQSIGTLTNESGVAWTKVGPITWNLGAAFNNWHWAGDAGEEICLPIRLNETDQARIRYWLAMKWGISGVHYQPFIPV